MEIANLFKYVAAFLGAFLLCDLLTKAVLNFCKKHSLVDAPGERKLHTAPIPRLGGVALSISFVSIGLLYSIFYSHLADDISLSDEWVQDFIFPVSVLMLVGILDDLYSLSPFFKLSGQLTSVSLLIIQGTTVGHVSIIEVSPVVDIVLTILWFLLIINAFNLIDGLDGLAGGIATIAGFGLFGIFMISNSVFPALIVLIFTGAVCGFLRHNFHPAKIFLGDTGSMVIGLCLAAFTLQSPSKGSTIATLGACVLALGLPLLDTTLAIWRRSLRTIFSNGGGLMSADMDHLHHRLVRKGVNQRKVALLLYAFSSVMTLFGVMSLLFSSYAHGIYLIAFTFGTYVIFRHLAHVELWDSGTAILRGISKPSVSTAISFLYPIADVTFLVASFLFAMAVTGTYSSWGEYRLLVLSLAPVWVGVSFIFLCLARTYDRVWSRARISEYLSLGAALFLGSWFAAGLSNFLAPQQAPTSLASFTVLFFGSSVFALFGLRSLPRIISDLMFYLGSEHQKKFERKVLVIGANVLLLKSLNKSDSGSNGRMVRRVIGLVDSDRSLRKRIVYGFKVLGTPPELWELLDKLEIDEIILDGTAPDIDKATLFATASQFQIPVSVWTVETRGVEQYYSPLQVRVIREVKQAETPTVPDEQISKTPVMN